MKRQAITKTFGTKKVTVSHLVAKNEVAKGRRVKIVKDDHLKLEQLNRALQTYAMNLEIDSPDFIHETGISFTDFLSDKLILVKLIRKGIPYSIFKLILNITPFSLNDWANYLDISVKSLIRYQQQDKTFKPGQSEKIIELAEVNNLGLEVFGNNAKFRRWLETPNYSLGNLKPFDLLKDSYGKEMIMGELTRIEYGILV